MGGLTQGEILPRGFSEIGALFYACCYSLPLAIVHVEQSSSLLTRIVVVWVDTVRGVGSLRSGAKGKNHWAFAINPMFGPER